VGSTGIESVKIARATLGDGQSLVGLSLSPADVPQVKQRLGIGTPLGDASTQELLDLVQGGSLIELDNGWRLAASQIAGDDVIELVLNGVPANRDELLGYGFLEEIVHFKRRWFVLEDDASAILSHLLSRKKAVRDMTVTDAQSNR
jgi:hypothetical protein